MTNPGYWGDPGDLSTLDRLHRILAVLRAVAYLDISPNASQDDAIYFELAQRIDRALDD